MNVYSDYRLGELSLPNRFVMSPMTRSRALAGNVPNPLAAIYYAQRATAGLLITEGTQISPQGVGYIRTPGMHSAEQVAGWRVVTDAVHKAGGRIFAQLWHVGRVSHPDFHGGALPVGPSAIAAVGEAYTVNGRQQLAAPRALTLNEIPDVIEQFRSAAVNAKEAGFDGVELHGANGYLLDQFLRDGANVRTDEYGGGIQSRARLALEATDAVISIWGPSRVGYKISPYFSNLGMSDSSPIETFSYLAKELGSRGIGYLHIAEAVAGAAAAPAGTPRATPVLRRLFGGPVISNGGYNLELANAAIGSNETDLVAFGVPFLANPDLTERWKRGAPLNAPQFDLFYTGEERGYTDYPTLAQQVTA
ncbi:MAG TPA: alkene reductase [Vicinamibacterales bacterium]|nr:alkene reductase [Vicinamibacterales bacterium]